MRSNSVQLAWPFALIGGAVGAQLPASTATSIILALVLGIVGAVVSSAIERVRDWQVALLSPLVGAVTGITIGADFDGFGGGVIGLIAGLGFGLLALPALVVITDGARRAHRLPADSLLGRAQRRRIWLLALTTSSLAALVVPALANPFSHPAEAPIAQLCALATMLTAMADAALWLAVAQPVDGRRSAADGRQSGSPYRESAAPPDPPAPRDMRGLAVLAAESLLYDALLVAVVAAALLVSR